jgi:hypothetical protein
VSGGSKAAMMDDGRRGSTTKGIAEWG